MKPTHEPRVRCAIYTRTATTPKPDDLPTSLAAQRRAARAFIDRQRPQGWFCLPDRYDDDGHSGITLDRPAMKRLLADIRSGRIDHLVVYRLDRLTRSLSDLTTLLAIFKEYNARLNSVTEDLDDYPILGLKQQVPR